MNADLEYFTLAEFVLRNGVYKEDRTKVGCYSVLGGQARYNLKHEFPLLTTKKVFWKGIVHELLWFLSGSTNIKYLIDNGVNIWNDNAYQNYLKWWTNSAMSIQTDGAFFGKDIGARSYAPLSKEEYLWKMKGSSVFAQTCGDLGEGTYGQMWRAFPYFEEGSQYESRDGFGIEIKTLDQISNVIKSLKENPNSRRHIVSAWHPELVNHCALPPCHCLFQFHVEELTHGERCLYWKAGEKSILDVKPEELDAWGCPRMSLSLELYQRSADLFLGVPFNIASYALLLKMVAQVVNMVPREFVHTFGDLHIYKNHVAQIKEQLKRKPIEGPQVTLNNNISDIFKFKYDDIKLEGYNPHPSIKGEMAV